LPDFNLARRGQAGDLVHVGMAGERRGQGLRGTLTVYRRGKAAVSGLGKAVLDRGFPDPNLFPVFDLPPSRRRADAPS
jgi:hypothetical protein